MKGEIPRWIWGLCLAALIVRIIALCTIGSFKADYAKSDIGRIPYSIVQGEGYSYAGRPSAFFGPGYSYLWAGSMAVFGKVTGQLLLQLLQSACLALLPFLWYRIATRTGAAALPAAFVAAAAAFYPELILLGGTLYSDGIVIVLWSVFLDQLLRTESGRWYSPVMAGIAGGLMAMMRDGTPTVNPDNYNFAASFDAITMVILGGSGSVTGSAIGGVFITFTIKAIELLQATSVVQDLKRSFEGLDLNALRMIVYAVVLIVLMILRPEGLLGEREIFRKKA